MILEKIAMPENVQLFPSDKILVPLDKLANSVFKQKNREATERAIYEDKRLGIVTTYDLEFLKGFLTQLDKLVFCAATSEYLVGNKFFSVRRLWQKIGGSHTMTSKTRKLIADSVERLACTRITLNMTDINEQRHYKDDRQVIRKNYLLPCKVVETKINGQTSDLTFYISDIPPLLEVTEMKKQFTTQPSSLLDVPKLKSTALTLSLKFYLLERITAILGSHKPHKKHFCGKGKDGKLAFKSATKLQKIILLDALFEQCGLSDAVKWQKQEARNVIKKTLDHFQAQHLISEWHFEKKNGAFYSIHFA